MLAIPNSASVVIVGAGPAGLTAGIALADAGVDVVLLDRLAEGANTSRAAVVHARTLEVLEEFGIGDELRDLGLQVPHFVLHDGDRPLARVSFEQLPTRYPYALLVGQETTEAVLLARLEKAGAGICRPVEVTGIVQDDEGVTVDYRGPGDATGTIRADYVIGADGMHSVARQAAGIDFTGSSYEESFVLADVRMTWPDPRDQVALQLSPEGVTVVAPLPDDHGDRYRIVATVAEAPEHPSSADVQAILDDRRPGSAAVVREVLWSSRFRVHHRVAEHYRDRRILLAGDAAHVHSPAGGQGMNTGIQDAAVLGGLLGRVVAGEPDSLLDDYENVRRPIALGVVSFTDRVTRMATLRGRSARAVRDAVVRTVTKVPALRRQLAFELSELGNR